MNARVNFKGKGLFILLFSTFTAYFSQAQTDSLRLREELLARQRFISNIYFLLGSGPVFYRGDDYTSENVAFKLGYSANVVLLHKFTAAFQLTSIIAYETKGTKLVGHSLDDTYSPPAETKFVQDITLHYGTVTLLPRYSFTRSRKLFVGFGPYLGYLHRTKVITDYYVNGALFLGSGAWPDPKIDNKLFDVGLTGLLGINLRSDKKLKGNIQLMYKKGMVDINQPMIAPMRNNSISLLFGIKLK